MACRKRQAIYLGAYGENAENLRQPAQLPTTIGDLSDLGQLSGGEDPKPCPDQVRMACAGRDSPAVTLIR